LKAISPELNRIISVALQKLPPLPQVINQAMRLMQQDVARQEVAKVLALDESITSLCLRMVNSAYYSLPRRVVSLNEAIGFLGFDLVTEIIVTASTTKLFVRSVPAYMMDRTALWRHSAAVAAGCDWIGRRRGIYPTSELYVAGLLHDIGKLAIDLLQKHGVEPQKQPAFWERLPEEVSEETDWLEIEKASVGHDHAEIGGMLAQRWRLTERTVEAIACHHAPSAATVDPAFAAAVHVANVAATMCGIGVGIGGLRVTLDDKALARLSLTPLDISELMVHISDSVDKAEALLGMHEGTLSAPAAMTGISRRR
jgi:HD-like signal output (HDOD) protein